MDFKGFIGPAYTLRSVNVEAQQCINLYPELIESGDGKEGNIAYLASTPGLTKLISVGTGPIRCVHVDYLNRVFVVSGNQLFAISNDTTNALFPVSYTTPTFSQSGAVNIVDDTIDITGHGYFTGLKVQVSSSGTLPTGLSAGTDYYVIVNSVNIIQLATSLANAVAGTFVNMTAINSGNMTITPQLPSRVSGIAQANFNVSTSTITKTAHGLYTGLNIQFSTLCAVTGGFSFLTNYYVIKVDADNFKLATSVANASAGTMIAFTSPSGSWTQTLIGSDGLNGGDAQTLDTSSGVVKAASMSFLGDGTDSSTLFADGSSLYWFENDIGATSFGNLTSFGYSSVSNPQDIVWVDGFFIVNQGGTNVFWVSDIQSPNFSGLNFASAEGYPDIILALALLNRYVYIFNEKTTEVYIDTGNAAFPFERIQGGFIEIGLAAQRSVAKINSTLCWLGRNAEGQGIVYAINGINPQRISTHAIETAIKSYADMTTATAYSYQSGGHYFYVLNFAEATWVYDLTTSLWHQRAYTNSGVLERHRVDNHAFHMTTGFHIVGDYSNSNVYQFDDSVYTDNLNAITRLRASPHISSELKRIFCSKFQLDMETGVGLSGGVQGSTPTVMMDFSDDGGHTWSSQSFALADGPAGAIGNYKTRVIWRRLGSFRDRVFRIQITDPVKVVLMAANFELQKGVS